MAVVKVSNFFGEWPRVAGVKLPDGFASKAVNCDFSSGMLRGVLGDEDSTRFPSDTQSALFVDSDSALTWGSDVDSTKSPITELISPRVYWSGGGATGLQVTRIADALDAATYAKDPTNAATITANLAAINTWINGVGSISPYDVTRIPACLTALANLAASDVPRNSASIPDILPEFSFSYLNLANDEKVQRFKILANAYISAASRHVTAQKSSGNIEDLVAGDLPMHLKGANAGNTSPIASVSSDFVGVPAPIIPPALYESVPVIGHLVAHFEVKLANERSNGALTEVFPATLSTTPADNLTQSQGFTIIPHKDYRLAKRGPNSVNDILRTSHGARGSRTWPSTSGGAFSAPSVKGAVHIGAALVLNEDGANALNPDGTPIIDVNKPGITFPAYYSEDAAVAYFRVTGDYAKTIASQDYINGVLCPFLSGVNGKYPYWDMEAKDVLTLTDAKVTFKRCTPRNKYESSKSSWFYWTGEFYPHPNNRMTTISAYNKASTADSATYLSTANEPAYEVSLSPVIANDTDGNGGLDSNGPVIIMDCWLAEREVPVRKDSTINLYGSILYDAGDATAYAPGEEGLFINSTVYDYVTSSGTAPVIAPKIAALKSKLTKVFPVIRLDGESTLPEQLKGAVTAVMTVPSIETLENNTGPSTVKLSLQTNYDKMDARSYVYTYVNEYGEEGPPSPPVVFSDIAKDSTINLRASIPVWDSHRYAPITKVRLYRTSTGSASTAFLFVKEIDLPYMQSHVGTSSVRKALKNGVLYNNTSDTTKVPSSLSAKDIYRIYTRVECIRNSSRESDASLDPLLYDNNNRGYAGTKVTLTIPDTTPDSELGESLSTQNYYPPPRTDYGLPALRVTSPLQGLTMGHNGMMAAFEGKNVWISEPYLPYAYDPSAVQTLPYEVVGICATENYFFVTTRGNPYILSGNTPQTIVNQRIPSDQAGVSKNSVVNIGDTVVYASTDGLVTCQGMNVSLELSSKLFTREKWLANFNTYLSLMGIAVQDNYMLVYGRDVNNTNGKAMLFDMSAGASKGVTRLSQTLTANAEVEAIVSAFNDPYSDTLYVARTSSVKAFMGNGYRRRFNYMTRRVYTQKPDGMAVLQILGRGVIYVTVIAFDVSSAVDLASVPLTDVTLPEDQGQGTGVGYTDKKTSVATGVVTFSTMNLDVQNWMRLPSGARSRMWAIEIWGEPMVITDKVVTRLNAEVWEINLASSMSELKDV